MDSLKKELKKAKHDTARIKIFVELGLEWQMLDNDSAAIWYTKASEHVNACLGKYPKTSKEYTSLRKSSADALSYLGYICQIQSNFPKAKELYEQCMKIQEETGDIQGLAVILSNVGYLYLDQGDLPKALEYMIKALKIQEKYGDRQNMAITLGNIGIVHLNKGDIAKALDYYTQSLKIMEEIGDKVGIATSYNNIGYVYEGQGDIQKTLEYYTKSLRIREEIGDKDGQSVSLNNLGYLYDRYGDLSVKTSVSEARNSGISKALACYEKSLKIQEEIGDRLGAARTINNMGNIYVKLGNIPKALECLNTGLRIREEIGDKPGVANSLSSLGGYYLKVKNYPKAIEYASRSLRMSQEIGIPDKIREPAQTLYLAHKISGNFRAALVYYEIFIQMRDSINNETTRKASVRQQLKHEYETKAAADSVTHAKETEIKNAELKKQEAEIRAKKNQQYALFGGLALVMIFAGLMFNRYKITQRQKVIIEQQKEEVEQQKNLVEEKQREILDSIRYAKRIQQAQMPSERSVKSSLSRLKN